MNMLNLPDQFSDLSQEQKDKLTEIGFCYIKSLLKEMEIEADTAMQELSSAKQTQKMEQWIKQVSQL